MTPLFIFSPNTLVSWLVACAFWCIVDCCCTAIDSGGLVVDRDLTCDLSDRSSNDSSASLSFRLDRRCDSRLGDTVVSTILSSRSSFSISRFANCHSLSILRFSSSRFSASSRCRCWSLCSIAFVSSSNLRTLSCVVALKPAYVKIAISSLLCFVWLDPPDAVELVSPELGPVSLDSLEESTDGGAEIAYLERFGDAFDEPPRILESTDSERSVEWFDCWFLLSCICTISLTEHWRSFKAMLCRIVGKLSDSCFDLA